MTDSIPFSNYQHLHELLEIADGTGHITLEQVDAWLPQNASDTFIKTVLRFLNQHGVDIKRSEFDLAEMHARRFVSLTRAQELGIGKRVEAIQFRIRDKVFQTGMAGRYHVNVAKTILDKAAACELEYGILDVDPEDSADYLAKLPALIDATEKQHWLCGEAWNRISEGAAATVEFQRVRAALIALLEEFRFSLWRYERLVRQTDKEFLASARMLSEDQAPDQNEVRRLESILRMRLGEFIDLEDQIAADLRQLDKVRSEWVLAHELFARHLAEMHPSGNPDKFASAMFGLQRAAATFRCKRGYRFAIYASHWVKKYIDEGRLSERV